MIMMDKRKEEKGENVVGERGSISRRRLLKLAAYSVPAMSFMNVANTVRASGHTTPPPPPGRCPNSYGYWKNHPEAWPVDSLTLGDEYYSKDELLNDDKKDKGSTKDKRAKGDSGDASLILAHQLIAAKLNIANGCDPNSISVTIALADSLLSPFAGKLPYGVRPSSADGQPMVTQACVLEDYNTGELTPVCDP